MYAYIKTITIASLALLTAITAQTQAQQVVNLSLSLPDSLAGNFSVSITDNRFVAQDSASDNIVSSLLLTSELHGNVDKPAQYFRGDISQVRSCRGVDLVMMTNGWRRFNVTDIIQGVGQKLPLPVELGQVIAGKVISPYAKNLAFTQVLAQIITTDSTRISDLYKGNRFEISDLDIAGTKKVSLITINRLNKPREAKIVVDTLHKTPSPWTKLHHPINQLDRQKEAEQEILAATDMNDIFKAYNAEAVIVSAKRKVKVQNLYEEDEYFNKPNRLSKKLSLYASPFNQHIVSINPNLSLERILKSSRTGRLRDDDKIEPPYSGWYRPQFMYVVDGGLMMPCEMLPSLMGNEIVAIELHWSVAYRKDLVIIETIYNNPNSNRVTLKDMIVIDFVGYDKCEKEFYQPKYIKPQQEYDTNASRPTLYWNPSVNLSTTPTQIQFFTADDEPATYTVTIEGILEVDHPVSTQKTIEITTRTSN